MDSTKFSVIWHFGKFYFSSFMDFLRRISSYATYLQHNKLKYFIYVVFYVNSMPSQKHTHNIFSSTRPCVVKKNNYPTVLKPIIHEILPTKVYGCENVLNRLWHRKPFSNWNKTPQATFKKPHISTESQQFWNVLKTFFNSFCVTRVSPCPGKQRKTNQNANSFSLIR